MNNGEIIIYQSDAIAQQIEVRLEDETVWLTQMQMVELFASTKQNISLHINNVYKEGELEEGSTVKEYLTVQQEGNRKIKRQIKIYNLDVIISVGYRVKSQRGTQFRIWATNILKTYLLKGYVLNNRIEVLENKVAKLQEKSKNFDLLLQTSLPHKEGIFFDGQIFDAYAFAADIIRSAKKSIQLIDNYVDDTVLKVLTKRNNKTNCTIYTKIISKSLELDLKKHNEQYAPITIKQFNKSHDRFLIVDGVKVYHLGASLKDLGKKWFAFSLIEKNAISLMEQLEGKG